MIHQTVDIKLYLIMVHHQDYLMDHLPMDHHVDHLIAIHMDHHMDHHVDVGATNKQRNIFSLFI